MITVSALNYRYRGSDKLVLDNINLEIEKQSVFGLLGPNGAGKTTLISVLTGLLSPQGGSVSVMGYQFPADSRRIKSLNGYVPQGYAFYPNLTAGENLQFFAGIQGLCGKKKQARIQYCLDFCQLNDVVKQPSSQFSGGLKRRLNLAIGLLTDPEILYLDEPTVGIDPQSRTFILEQIGQLRDQGKTVIYTSHYMEEIEQVCDHLAIIDNGKVLISGTLSDLQGQQTPQCRIGIDQPLSEQHFAELSERYSVVMPHADTQLPCELIFKEIHQYRDCLDLTQKLEEYGVHICSVSFGKTNLEDIFLNLTHRELRD